ncbi:hypothetical protein GCM10009837_72610 [Streptomyces durmitorensis]|uniref:Uncharacterized protein n=1 Tax=Streptomyces durmitorensis TaxID=319947 RepID=A0ABY4PMA6_9ACTN|nr:hypothetical protein [Streptomyces durmitorensis]UQT53994.1 hypothetical protein M4V62_02270 [Streptomyces durmitorensis]
MNETPGPASTAAQPDSPDLVQVVLGECSAADADAVFGVLRSHFPSDRGEEAPHRTEQPRPAVWTGAFLAAHSPGPVRGVLLAGPVTADLQGAPVAVGRLRATLASAFVAADTGTASGDQEVQVQLRLTGAEHGEPPLPGR